jgi:hypothetical protein
MPTRPADRVTPTAVVSTIAFLVLTPFIAGQLRSEWGQVAVTVLVSAAFGYYLGRLLSPRQPVAFFKLGGVIGLLLWLCFLVIARSCTREPGSSPSPG